MTIDEMITVLQAAKEGKMIQIRNHGQEQWSDCGPFNKHSNNWGFETHDYRIKPEPMEIWVNVYGGHHFGGCYELKEEAEKAWVGKADLVVAKLFREVI